MFTQHTVAHSFIVGSEITAHPRCWEVSSSVSLLGSIWFNSIRFSCALESVEPICVYSLKEQEQ